MDQDRQQQLLNLKQKVVNNLVPLMLEGDGSPEEVAETALNMIELGAVPTELYAKVFDTVTKIENPQAKAEYLTRLLGVIQTELSKNVSETEEVAPDQPYEEQQDSYENSGEQGFQS